MVIVKFSHTWYRALGPELIPVYRQSAHRWLFKSSPSSRQTLISARLAVTFPAEKRHSSLAGTKLYCLVTEAHSCEQLAQGCYAALSGGNWTHDLLIASPTPSLRHQVCVSVRIILSITADPRMIYCSSAPVLRRRSSLWKVCHIQPPSLIWRNSLPW